MFLVLMIDILAFDTCQCHRNSTGNWVTEYAQYLSLWLQINFLKMIIFSQNQLILHLFRPKLLFSFTNTSVSNVKKALFLNIAQERWRNISPCLLNSDCSLNWFSKNMLPCSLNMDRSSNWDLRVGANPELCTQSTHFVQCNSDLKIYNPRVLKPNQTTFYSHFPLPRVKKSLHIVTTMP